MVPFDLPIFFFLWESERGQFLLYSIVLAYTFDQLVLLLKGTVTYLDQMCLVKRGRDNFEYTDV
jgi:hypothetical protein